MSYVRKKQDRTGIKLGLAGILFLLAVTARSQSNVTMEEQTLVIPTYGVAPPDKDPIFYSGRAYQGAQGPIYPHPMYDVLTGIKKDQAYKVVNIENEYTRFCVAPQLGGRILSAQDKSDQYDFFYHQHVIKPALIGMIGAWISGGVEWNIPDHHRATSNLPIDYTLQSNPDGSRTIWVGETELSRSLRWVVGLTLHPGRSYIEATVKVINATPFAQSFLYWANVSVHANKDYQVIFPPSTQFGAQHAKREFVNWPIGQGMYGGVDRTGVDLSRWKNFPSAASIFAWNFTDDFLAGYDHGKDAGTVHVANHHIVTGKKFFEWGNNEAANMWEKMLTDSDGQYLELMVGAYSDNQPDYAWIAPGETKVFTQYWYPVKKIGGVKKANVDAAINVDRPATGTLRVGLNATALYRQASVILSAGGKVLDKATIDIDPNKPFVREFSIDPSLSDTAIKVALLDGEGRELISYQPVTLTKEEMPKPVEVPRPPKDYASNEELYLTGLRLEQFRNATIDPMPYYSEALRRDSLDYLVNNAVGILYNKSGRFEEAEKCFQRSIRRITNGYTHPKSGEAFYYLGVSLQFQDHRTQAADALWKATWYPEFQSPAFFRLAELACIDHRYTEALQLVDQSLSVNNLNTSALALKATILRKLGENARAMETARLARQIDPLDNWSAAETYFLDAIMEDRGLKTTDPGHWKTADLDSFKTRISGNVQSVLELSRQYANVGSYDAALQILDQYRRSGEPTANFPLLSYYTGYYQYKKGDTAAAKKCFQEGAQASPDYCFPFRLEEIAILETAVRITPTDAKAWYYLGNLHYFLDQKKKAIADWQQSAQRDDHFYLAFRNLGFAYQQVDHDLSRAIPAYEKSIDLNHQDPRLFAELDVLKAEAGVPAVERLAFLEKNRTVIEGRDDAITPLIELYNVTGQYEKALQILTTRHFHVWEGGGSIHTIFAEANLLKGIREMEGRQYKRALLDIQTAATYPDNLEVGRPNDGGIDIKIDYFMALAYTGLKNNAMAKECFEKAAGMKMRDRPSDLNYYQAMALKKLGRMEEANSLFDRLDSYATKQLASVEGMDFFSKFGTASSRSARLAANHYLLGLAEYGKGNTDQAAGQFNKTVELDQYHIWAKWMLQKKAG
jgi:tetratricopeptide (TPR) repeat protein